MSITIKIPEGFKEFIEANPEIEEYPMPKSTEEIVRNGQREACLAKNVTSAQQLYIFDLLDDAGFLEKTDIGYENFRNELAIYLERRIKDEEDIKRKNSMRLAFEKRCEVCLPE